MTPTQSPLAPVLMTAAAAILWGLWWIPIRLLGDYGLTGIQSGMLLNFGGAVSGLFVLVILRKPLRMGPRTLLGGVMVGLALACYSIGLALSDVVRVILLFYLAPAWSKIIEWAFMGRPWHWSSTITVAVSLCGAALVLGGRLGSDGINIGDGLAILSGVAWAIGAALTFTGPKTSALPLTCVTLVTATVLAAGFGALMGETPLPDAATKTLLLGLAFGVIFATPVMFATMWSAQRLGPALISFLFTLEICSGVISGALFLDEPYGVFQIAGTVLIITAALSEVVFALRTKPNAS